MIRRECSSVPWYMYSSCSVCKLVVSSKSRAFTDSLDPKNAGDGEARGSRRRRHHRRALLQQRPRRHRTNRINLAVQQQSSCLRRVVAGSPLVAIIASLVASGRCSTAGWHHVLVHASKPYHRSRRPRFFTHIFFCPKKGLTIRLIVPYFLCVGDSALRSLEVH